MKRPRSYINNELRDYLNRSDVGHYGSNLIYRCFRIGTSKLYGDTDKK